MTSYRLEGTSMISFSPPTDRSILRFRRESTLEQQIGHDIHGCLPEQAPGTVLWHGDADPFNLIAQWKVVIEIVEEVDLKKGVRSAKAVDSTSMMRGGNGRCPRIDSRGRYGGIS
jgi:hypothetical protein